MEGVDDDPLPPPVPDVDLGVTRGHIKTCTKDGGNCSVAVIEGSQVVSDVLSDDAVIWEDLPIGFDVLAAVRRRGLKNAMDRIGLLCAFWRTPIDGGEVLIFHEHNAPDS